MNRINFGRQSLHFIVFVLLQILLLYKFILFDVAFGFFYIGFILYLPFGINRSTSMAIAFAVGVIIDIFSSTPGIHTSACVLVAFIKDFWASTILRSADEDTRVNWNELQLWGSLKYLVPLVLIHHFMIFTIENDGFHTFFFLLKKILFSSLYTLFIVLCLSILMAPSKRQI